MKNIVVATDFSPIALNAVHYALDLSMAINARLTLLNTYQLPISYTEVPLVTISLDEIKKISEDGLLELKQNLEKISRNRIEICTESQLGDVAEVLKKIEKEVSITLIIAGTMGLSGLERFFVGSNTLRMIENTNAPVMAIPPGVKYKAIEKMILATDLDDVELTTASEKIKYFVELFNAKLFVVNVDHNKKHFTEDTPQETIKLDELLNPLEYEFSFIENENVSSGINQYAEKNNIDLIIMLPKLHSLIEKIFEKSNSRELMYQSKIPILHLRKTN